MYGDDTIVVTFYLQVNRLDFGPPCPLSNQTFVFGSVRVLEVPHIEGVVVNTAIVAPFYNAADGETVSANSQVFFLAGSFNFSPDQFLCRGQRIKIATKIGYFSRRSSKTTLRPDFYTGSTFRSTWVRRSVNLRTLLRDEVLKRSHQRE
jgi:hypothetical protein